MLSFEVHKSGVYEPLPGAEAECLGVGPLRQATPTACSRRGRPEKLLFRSGFNEGDKRRTGARCGRP